ncbi:hypothetical protein [Paludisphaera mucosa]|uniref:Uncharacterized protein n=1 Tax=Paludisphaera mucosa TaxID=3030827 RepID=A0ABT6FCG3_9BACT|nr:hypothetical protein [Paludisphaera mucosa]MDG3005280.1 hypothetical protein [Paludisphaera mucosa]
MSVPELELFATEDLIEEVLRRTTFQGVVIHSRDAVGNGSEPDERTFSVRFNGNFQTGEVGRLLDVVSRRLADAV